MHQSLYVETYQAYRLLQNIHDLEMKLWAKHNLLNGFMSVAQFKQIFFMQASLAGPPAMSSSSLLSHFPVLDTAVTLLWLMSNNGGAKAKTDACRESLEDV